MYVTGAPHAGHRKFAVYKGKVTPLAKHYTNESVQSLVGFRGVVDMVAFTTVSVLFTANGDNDCEMCIYSESPRQN
jgi:hypothetical protein